jgi:hypothetical protein
MVVVTRHHTDQERADKLAAKLAERTPVFIDLVAKNPRALNSVLSRTLMETS